MKEIVAVLIIVAVLLAIAPFFGMAISGAFITVWIVGIPALLVWAGWKWLSCQRRERE